MRWGSNTPKYHRLLYCRTIERPNISLKGPRNNGPKAYARMNTLVHMARIASLVMPNSAPRRVEAGAIMVEEIGEMNVKADTIAVADHLRPNDQLREGALANNLKYTDMMGQARQGEPLERLNMVLPLACRTYGFCVIALCILSHSLFWIHGVVWSVPIDDIFACIVLHLILRNVFVASLLREGVH